MSDNSGHVFVLITCNDRLVDSIVEEIQSISFVTKVDRVQGMYDIVVQLDAPSEMLKETIRTNFRYIDGVRSVLTLFEYGTSQITP